MTLQVKQRKRNRKRKIIWYIGVLRLKRKEEKLDGLTSIQK